MNKMYEYLKNHAYISYYKKSTYEFELTKERAECIVNKHNNLIKDLEEENKQLKEDIQKLQKELNEENLQCSKNAIEINDLKEKCKELDKMCELYSKSLYNAELNQYKDNWNKLKEHCNIMLSIFEKMNEQTKQEQLDKYVIYDKFLSKMQELEQGSDSNE